VRRWILATVVILLLALAAPAQHVAGAVGRPSARRRPSTGPVVVTIRHPVTRRTTADPFEPIRTQRIALPSRIKEASTPVFTLDGHHLMFASRLRLWIVNSRGHHLHCLSCGLANQPTLAQGEQMGFTTEFPDRKRVFFGAAGSLGVLECHPSVVHCTSRKILPVDLSGARPSTPVGGPPGGSPPEPGLDLENGSSPKLSPDGHYVVFSDITTNAVELMTIARLRRTATKYVASEPRVLNPTGPSSVLDTDTKHWSNSSALFEFKSFADGGAAATYVQVGGVAAFNPDVWQVNLATGRRKRLTASPDWDEDDAPSPNGRSIVIESDRTMHRVDMLGALLPVRGFIDAPAVSIAASYYVAGPVPRQCDLQPWLFPASGDRGATLMGQPIQPYTGGPVHAANNVSGYPQWSPDGTRIALNTESYRTNRSARYLLVAHLLDRRPTKPMRVVSSKPGAWAPTPEHYHGAIGSDTTVVLHGHASGTATVTYANPLGVLQGVDSVTYHDYSDNGRDVVNGTNRVSYPASILTGPVDLNSHLTLSGHDHGSSNVDLTFSGTQSVPVTVTGTASTSYDGTTVTGPPRSPAPCPNDLPRKPHLALHATRMSRHGHRVLRVHVTARVAGDGRNEAVIEVRPVVDAVVAIAGVRARTSRRGVAYLRVRRSWRGHRLRLTATAGDTLRRGRGVVRVPR
jgi:hypothetical protein